MLTRVAAIAALSVAFNFVALSLVRALSMTTMPGKMMRMQLTIETGALRSLGVTSSNERAVGFNMLVEVHMRARTT